MVKTESSNDEYSIDNIIVTEEDLKNIAHSLKKLDDDSMKEALELFVYNKKFDNALLINKQRIIDVFIEYQLIPFYSYEVIDGLMVLRIHITRPIPCNKAQSGKSFLRKLVDASISYFDIEVYANGVDNITFIFREMQGVREEMQHTVKYRNKNRNKSRR